MQRRGRGNRYHVSGAAAPNLRGERNERRYTRYTHDIPSKRKRNTRKDSHRRAQYALRRLIAAAVGMALIVGIVYLFTLIPRRESSNALRLGFPPSSPMQTFGRNLLFLNNGVLNCVGPNGGVIWQYPLGREAGFHASGSMVIGWTGNQLCIINSSGAETFRRQMTATIQFARIGASYAATLIGDMTGATLRVTDLYGNLIEDIDDFQYTTLVDFGFFDTQDLRLWTLGLDLHGSSPATKLNTYDPRSRSSTGAATLPNELVYRVYIQNRWLMLVSSVSIHAYNYNCTPVAGQSPATIYGWQLTRTMAAQSDTYALLTRPAEADGSRSMRTVRLISRNSDQLLRLPSECFDALLGSRGVYGFSSDMVYTARYGQTRFSSYQLEIQVDRVLDMLEGDIAVLASKDEVYLYKLPGG